MANIMGTILLLSSSISLANNYDSLFAVFRLCSEQNPVPILSIEAQKARGWSGRRFVSYYFVSVDVRNLIKPYSSF